MNTKGFVTGSFDPITQGHINVVYSALSLFESVVIGVANNPNKIYTFGNVEKRKELVEQCFDDDRIEVVVVQNNLSASIAKDLNCTHFIRGVRSGADADYELNLIDITKHFSDIPTILIPSDNEDRYISSSMVRELMKYKNKQEVQIMLQKAVPDIIYKEIMK
jgi:pantetheine-phosphate adenylyltransferase